MMTLKEVLQITADILGNIQVPAVLTEQVAIPISNARNNLMECLAAIDRDEKKTAEGETEDGI